MKVWAGNTGSRIILGYSATKFNYKHWEPPAHEISEAS